MSLSQDTMEWMEHDNYWFTKFIVCLVIVLIVTVTLVGYAVEESNEEKVMIDELSCGELIDFILEDEGYNSSIRYAERRHLWMCEK